MSQQPSVRPRDRASSEPGGGRALSLAAAGVLLSSALLPWGYLGLAVEVAAFILAFRARRRARARRARAPLALPALIGAALAAVSFAAALGFVGAFHDEYRDYQHCVARAITDGAVDDCRAGFERAVRIRLELVP